MQGRKNLKPKEKIKQQLEVLRANLKFQVDVESLRKKYSAHLRGISEHKEGVPKKSWAEKHDVLIKNESLHSLLRECLFLCRKYFLFPSSVWKNTIIHYVAYDYLLPPSLFLKTENIIII